MRKSNLQKQKSNFQIYEKRIKISSRKVSRKVFVEGSAEGFLNGTRLSRKVFAEGICGRFCGRFAEGFLIFWCSCFCGRFRERFCGRFSQKVLQKVLRKALAEGFLYKSFFEFHWIHMQGGPHTDLLPSFRWAEPSRAELNQAEPSRAEPGRASFIHLNTRSPAHWRPVTGIKSSHRSLKNKLV